MIILKLLTETISELAKYISKFLVNCDGLALGNSDGQAQALTRTLQDIKAITVKLVFE